MQTKTLDPLLARNLDIFCCPACAAELSFGDDAVSCTKCGKKFTIENGIPHLFTATDVKDVTQDMKAFYEETPFPDYDDIDSKWRLIEKAEKGLFANLLNKQIRHGVRILEAGCGTGQLSNFLGITAGRNVIGADMCLNSLGLANKFKTENTIENVCFTQMNLFRPCFKPESFDLVISNGVLHHTSDPRGAYESILRLLKKGGFIIVGLYNTYGRLGTDFRRVIFNLTGDSLAALDPHLRNKMSGRKKKSWFNDQYKNPHESKHTIGEVQKWFRETGVEFINSIPKPTLLAPFTEDEKLFVKTPEGSAFDHFLVQAAMMLSGSQEGGLYIMIGRKTA